MKNLAKNIALIGFICALCMNIAKSQSINLVRTDVDSTRSNFVTATYLFAFDLKVENLDNCNNASILLKFNNTDHVKFSSVRIGDYGQEGTLIYDVREVGDETFISLGIFSGDGLRENEFDNPTLCNLEFVVKPTAPDEENVTFTFVNAFGAEFLSDIGDGSAIGLGSVPVTYDIHGYVDVWPGDTDRDSDVDNVDWNTIIETLDFETRFPGFRAFKRPNPSTNFYAQRALVWDYQDGTYADCDGDGHVSITDANVVAINLTKVASATRPKATVSSQSDDKFNPKFQDESTIAIPITAEYLTDYYGGTGIITWESDNYEVLGLEKGSLFDDSFSGIIQNKKSNSIEFTVVNFDDNLIYDDGEIAKIIVKPINPNAKFDFEIAKLKAFTSDRKIIELSSITSVINENKNFTISQNNNSIIVNSSKYRNISSLTLMSANGKTVYTINNNSLPLSVSENNLASGFYLLQIELNGKSETHPIVIK